jgi:hypothetical protein
MMPSKSRAQAKMFRAAAHSRSFARKVGVSQKLAKEWHAADKKAGKGKKRKR